MKYVWLVVLNALHTTTIILNHKYEVDTLGDGQVWDTHLAATDTAEHLISFDQWSVKALGTINKNVHDQHKEMRSQLQNRHTMMENHINQLSTKHTNHLGDYVEKVANMIYAHHVMMFNTLGAVAGSVAGSLDQPESLPDESFVPFQRHWYLGNVTGTCDETCALHDLHCTSNSASKQTALGPSNVAGAVAAFQEAGSSCRRIKTTQWQDDSGSPSVESKSGDCYGFGKDERTASSVDSTCNGNIVGHKPLCYCEVPNWAVGLLGESCTDTCSLQGRACTDKSETKQTGLDTEAKAQVAYSEAGYDCTTLNSGRDKKYAPYVAESSDYPEWCSWFGYYSAAKRKDKHSTCDDSVDDRRRLCWCDSLPQSGNLAGSSHENSSFMVDIKLNQWKLPPKLDVKWPEGHSSLAELISNEVSDHVEEVGTSVLSALGANVVSTRRLTGTGAGHFDFDVKWPNGGSHVLEEVKNHLDGVKKHLSEKVSQVEVKMEDKMEDQNDKMKDKFDKMEAKIEVKIAKMESKLEVKISNIESMIGSLLKKFDE